MDHRNIHGRACSHTGEHTGSDPPECAKARAMNLSAGQSGRQDTQAASLFNRLHMTTCGVPGFGPRSFLSLDQIEALTPSLVKGELKRRVPTLSEFDLGRYTAFIAAQTATSGITAPEIRTKPVLPRTFLILAFLNMLESIPVFISEGFTDSLLPINHAHFRGEKAARPSPPSSTDVVRRSFDGWTISHIEAFMSAQWVVLSPFFTSAVDDVAIYDFEARTVMPFTSDDLTCSSYTETDGHRKVKIHPSHHNFEHNQDDQYFSLRKLHCESIVEFQYEVAKLRQLAAGTPNSLAKPLAAFRHGTSFYSLASWDDDMYHSARKANPGPVINESFSKWILKRSRGISAALKGKYGESYRTVATRDTVESSEDNEPDDIVWMSSSTDGSGPPTALSTSGLEKLQSWLEARPGHSPGRQSRVHPTPGEDINRTCTWGLRFIGCVLLEDVVWIVHAWEGAVSFSLCPISLTERDEGINMQDGYSPKSAINPLIFNHEPGTTETDSNLGDSRAERFPFIDLLRLTRNELLNTNWKTGDSSALIVDKLRHLRIKCRSPGSTRASPRPPQPTLAAALHIPAVEGPSMRSRSVSIADSVAGGDSPATPSYHEPEDENRRSRNAFHSSHVPKLDRTMTDVYNDELYNPNFTLLDSPKRYNQDNPRSSPVKSPISQRSQHVETTWVSPCTDSFENLLHSDPNVELSNFEFDESFPGCSFLDNIQPGIPSEPNDVGPYGQKRPLDDITGSSDVEHDTNKTLCRTGDLLTDRKVTREAILEPPETAKGDILYACPFYKRDPAKYSKKLWKACFGPGWSISRLKEHIYRKHHSSRHRCNRCFADFENTWELDQHQRSDPPCLTQEPAPDIDTIDETQKAQIQKKLRGISDEQKWNEIYKTIFKVQSVAEIPSPYYEKVVDGTKGVGDKADNADSLADFEAYLHRLVDGDDQRDVAAIKGCLDLIQNFYRTKAGKQSMPPSEVPHNTHDPSNSTTVLPVPISSSIPLDASQNLNTAITGEANDPFWAHFNDLFSPDKSNTMP